MDLKILFIDDEASTLMMLKQWCWRSKIDATFISDPREIYKLNLSHYNLIITDYMLPHMDGMEIINYCQLQNPHLYYVLMTALSDYSLIKRAYKTPILDFITKPIDFARVVKVIENVKHQIDIDKFKEQVNKITL